MERPVERVPPPVGKLPEPEVAALLSPFILLLCSQGNAGLASGRLGGLKTWTWCTR